jgi:hypothetical protein
MAVLVKATTENLNASGIGQSVAAQCTLLNCKVAGFVIITSGDLSVFEAKTSACGRNDGWHVEDIQHT